MNFRNFIQAERVRYFVFRPPPMFLKRNFGSDRRRRKRQLLNTSVRVFTESGPIDALGINISDVGMSLFTIANLPIDSRIQIELLLPQSTERVRIWGIIRHRALYLYGVEFLVDSDRRSTSSWTDVQPSLA
ncbi:MAG TPA: PilZ domain-containing protein [Terriglobales bacterium]|nr:PilZ domain-containing protein [Terriglobales bacterium]